MNHDNKKYQIKTDIYSSHQLISSYIRGKIVRKIKLLDLGCDIGFLGKLLHDKNPNNFEIHGADVNRVNLDKAKSHYQKTYCFDLNQQIWPLKNTYDVIVLADTLEHLINPHYALKQIFKFLKPRGILILSVPNIVYWWARLTILFGQFPKQNRGIFDKTHLHFYTQKTALELLHEVPQSQVIDYFPTTLPLQFILNNNYFKYIIPILYEFSYKLALHIPSLFAYQHIYILQKNK